MDKFCYLCGMLSVDGDADAAVEARIQTGMFLQMCHWLVGLLSNAVFRDDDTAVGGRMQSDAATKLFYSPE